MREEIIKKLSWLFIALVGVVVGSSCQKSFSFDEPDCDFNSRLYIHYNLENTIDNNVMTSYAERVDVYVFDQSEVLVAAEKLDRVGKTEFVSKEMLGSGKYTAIAFANKSDELNKFVQPYTIGTTQKSDMQLYFDQVSEGNSDRLYYGYRAFEVLDNAINDVRIDMTHGHCLLHFMVRWKSVAPAQGDYRVVMEGVPSRYELVPEFFFRSGVPSYVDYLSPQHDYLTKETIHYFPTVLHTYDVVDHSVVVPMTVNKELSGTFVSYRLTNEAQTSLKIYDSNGAQLGGIVDLQDYFRVSGVELNHNRKQEFALELMIDGNSVIVSPLNVDDWDEGGNI